MHEAKVSPERNAVSVLVPEIKLLFFQVSGERYIPSEQSSLSAKCGSEFSYDFDAKNTNKALLATLVRNINIKTFVNNSAPALFRCSAKILHKREEMRHAIPKHILQNIQEQNVSRLSVVSGNVDSIKMQLLHLEGASSKEHRLTAIPRDKTKVDFTAYIGGNLFADSVSGGLDSAKSNNDLGEIIFEAGVKGISISLRFLSTLYVNPMEKNKTQDNTDNEKKSWTASQTHGSSMKTGSEHTVHHEEVTVEDKEQETKGLEEEPEIFSDSSVQKDTSNSGVGVDKKDSSVFKPSWKHNNYAPLGNSSSTISSDGSFAYKSSTRKGYVALDIDSGDIADQSDAEGDYGNDAVDDEKEEVSLLSGSDHYKGSSTGTRQAVRYKKRSSKRQSSMKDPLSVKHHVIITNGSGSVKVNNVWVNLAAPTHLQLCNSETEQDVNLVMVLVPALSCWITPAYELLTAIELFRSQIRQWKYSVLAAMMGQALPDNGKLLKKVVTSNSFIFIYY